MHVVSGILYKAPFVKQLTDSTMFAIKLSEVTKDRGTGEKKYVNYEAVLFAKTQAAIEFHTNATAEGSFVVVSCEKLQMKVSDCGQYTSMSMENARLDGANYPQASQGSQGQQAPMQQAPAQQQGQYQQSPVQQAPQQQSYQQAPQQAPQKAPMQQAPAQQGFAQPQQAPMQQAPAQNHGFYQPPANQHPQNSQHGNPSDQIKQAFNPNTDFDDDIPF